MQSSIPSYNVCTSCSFGPQYINSPLNKGTLFRLRYFYDIFLVIIIIIIDINTVSYIIIFSIITFTIITVIIRFIGKKLWQTLPKEIRVPIVRVIRRKSVILAAVLKYMKILFQP